MRGGAKKKVAAFHRSRAAVALSNRHVAIATFDSGLPPAGQLTCQFQMAAQDRMIKNDPMMVIQDDY
mgnify:CR=1 FL=1